MTATKCKWVLFEPDYNIYYVGNYPNGSVITSDRLGSAMKFKTKAEASYVLSNSIDEKDKTLYRFTVTHDNFWR